MSKDDQIFCDGVGSITVTGPVVRVDFVALSPNGRDADGNAKFEFTHRVVMPLDGFLGAVSKLQETVQALIRQGAIRQAAPSVAATSQDKPSQDRPASESKLPTPIEPSIEEARSAPPKPAQRPFP